MSFPEEVVYSPEKVYVKLSPGKILSAKPFTCSHTVMDLSLLRAGTPLKGPFYVKKLDCFLLFFDYPALSENQEIVMFMNDAITSNGQKIGIPPVKFKKNPKFKDKSAIKDYFR